MSPMRDYHLPIHPKSRCSRPSVAGLVVVILVSAGPAFARAETQAAHRAHNQASVTGTASAFAPQSSRPFVAPGPAASMSAPRREASEAPRVPPRNVCRRLLRDSRKGYVQVEFPC